VLAALDSHIKMLVESAERERKPWIGLTDEEVNTVWAGTSPYYHEADFARAIEDKLKEKNT
jgi:hypothetical protein